MSYNPRCCRVYGLAVFQGIEPAYLFDFVGGTAIALFRGGTSTHADVRIRN